MADSPVTTLPDSDAKAAILGVVEQFWGFSELRPLQLQAISAGIDQRDSLVVLPTGGGKSLCYQVPPVVADRMDVVVSPLIALMKDQVDGLRQNGYPAAAVHSNLTPRERDELRMGMRENKFRLLFVSPERLLSPRFLEYLKSQNVQAISIDEAHCISQWGHDFRLEYRRLAELKQHFPNASIHAYTATATKRVQGDIVEQLGLRQPRVIVGTFDRPNLVYRILPRVDMYRQTLEVVRRHDKEACIIYCITRKDTEAMAEFLTANGVIAAAYHAGMEKHDRTRVQDAFASEQLDVVAATVAFGMGIDRSNVRCIVHASMPKTIEHYQQETGRAGRDGLEAECVLLYSGGDVMSWQRIMTMSAERANMPEDSLKAQFELLEHMSGLCSTLECRHHALSRYFGQEYEQDNCGACDVCLGEVEGMKDATTVAQKVLSCVYRLGQSFGVGYVGEVLRGANTEKVRQRGHETLSTYGLLKDQNEKSIANIIYQLVDQGLLQRTPGDKPVLQLTDGALAVLRGEREVKLVEPGSAPVHTTKAAEHAWEGVDKGLFEHLRELRREIALQRSVPAYVIFSDAVLRELARVRPTLLEKMSHVQGVGAKKLEDLGPQFVEAIDEYCQEHELSTDEQVEVIVRPRSNRPNPQKETAMRMFAEGATIEQVMSATGRARSTLTGYLVEFIESQHPESVQPWVPDAVYERVVEAATHLAADRLRPIFEHLDEQVPFDAIRIVLAHHAAVSSQR